MIFDVAFSQLLRMLAFEFLEQIGGYLAQGVDQHIKPCAMGHADNKLLHAHPARRAAAGCPVAESGFRRLRRRSVSARHSVYAGIFPDLLPH